MDRSTIQLRSVPSQFEAREADDGYYIEGYFAVFGQDYEMFPGASESIAPGAFSKTLGGDIRALINHETRLVVGRTKVGTLKLNEDSHGLWGSIRINPKDTDAMNCRERVLRGDVDQCSIGFEIVDEETEFREDGSVHWTIRDVILHEVSVCTFPAYEQTSISARAKQYEEIRKRKVDERKAHLLRRLKGEKNGT
ncbi:MAG: HK97 family phage prohead protease [Bacteroidaceae bacterium]|nr:HK97 family phage prohead protease [Bacteroidaceae bacterium]